VLGFVIADKYGSSRGGARKMMGSVRMRSSARTHYDLNGQVGNDEVRSISSIPVNLSPIRRVRMRNLRGCARERPQYITIELFRLPSLRGTSLEGHHDLVMEGQFSASDSQTCKISNYPNFALENLIMEYRPLVDRHCDRRSRSQRIARFNVLSRDANDDQRC